MKAIKKILLGIIVGITALACSKKENTLVIGVSPIPHKEIIEYVKEDLKKEGIELEIVVFNDYVQPNLALKDKSLDANFFQHEPYMNSFAKENNIDMVNLGKIHVEPLKIYSDKLKTIDEAKNLEKLEILIPNDPTNRGRALILLETANILKLKDNKKLDSSLEDIESINKNYHITELNSEQIGPRLSEVELAVINTNNALASNIDASKAIFIEGKESPYANIIVALKENENNEKIKTLVKLLQTEKVKKFIENNYNNELSVAF